MDRWVPRLVLFDPERSRWGTAKVLNENIQKELARRYGGDGLQKMVKEAFDQRLVKALKEPFKDEAEAAAAIIFVDVAKFSEKVAGKNATQTRLFLDAFYAAAIPEIYQRSGHIDRIVGDGIVAVFTGYLTPGLTLGKGLGRALGTAEEIVKKLHGTPYESKAAISDGNVLFCRTGLVQVYEDYTIIGEPLTMAYRVEESVAANQVATPSESVLGKLIQSQVEETKAMKAKKLPVSVGWNVTWPTVSLRGIGDTKLALQTYTPPKKPSK
jgi:class 3 adenylate cyclase